MSDDELNALFAEKVAGWKPRDSSFEECQWEMPDGTRTGIEDWANDANAVLPWLEKWRRDDPDYRTAVLAATANGWQVELRDIDRTNALIAETTLARAVTIALLAAHNVTHAGKDGDA